MDRFTKFTPAGGRCEREETLPSRRADLVEYPGGLLCRDVKPVRCGVEGDAGSVDGEGVPPRRANPVLRPR